MPLVLVMSSHVAASRVGATPVAHALAMRKIDPVVVPTTLLGRHPGWGVPGGGGVPPELFAGMIEGVEAQSLFPQFDAVLTGYFASAAQIEAAAAAMERIRAVNPKALFVVDPILGDADGGLYVKAEVADLLPRRLLPLADLITPNLWELGFLSGAPLRSLADIAVAGRALARGALVSSVEQGDQIGALYADAAEAWVALGPKAAHAPHGTGDLLAGAFLASWIEGLPARQALHRAVGVVADVVRRAAAWNAPELPIVAAPDAFVAPGVKVSLAAVESPRD